MAHRVIVVGAGFAGFHTLRQLERKLGPREADLVLVTPQSYHLYQPLLPQVAAGVLSSRSIAVPLHRMFKRTHVIPGGVIGVDPDAKVCVIRKITGEIVNERYDRLVLAPGAVTRTFDIPGLEDFGRGMKNLAEAVSLRDHVIAQFELANSSFDPAERASRCGFIVVGGGYAGVETAACLEMVSTHALKRFPRLDPAQVNWKIVDVAPRLMPELGENLGTAAMEMLAKRGIDVRLETSVTDITRTTVTLSSGETVPCRTLVWTAGVTASPLIGTLGAETVRGRLVVGADLTMPTHRDVFSLGDCAAVPDLAKGDGSVCPPTAQYAQRQAKVAAHNVVASLRNKPLTEFRHKDLGLVVDLGGTQAVARPLGRDLRGLPAQVITRGYHLMAMPSVRGRTRVLSNWGIHAVGGDDFVRLGFLDSVTGSLKDFESKDGYLNAEQIAEQVGEPAQKGTAA